MSQNHHDETLEAQELNAEDLAEITGGLRHVIVPRPAPAVEVLGRFDTTLGSFEVPEIRGLPVFADDDGPNVSVGKTGPGVGVRVGGGF